VKRINFASRASDDSNVAGLLDQGSQGVTPTTESDTDDDGISNVPESEWNEPILSTSAATPTRKSAELLALPQRYNWSEPLPAAAAAVTTAVEAQVLDASEFSSTLSFGTIPFC
jgi:hypothetical protein